MFTFFKKKKYKDELALMEVISQSSSVEVSRDTLREAIENGYFESGVFLITIYANLTFANAVKNVEVFNSIKEYPKLTIVNRIKFIEEMYLMFSETNG